MFGNKAATDGTSTDLKVYLQPLAAWFRAKSTALKMLVPETFGDGTTTRQNCQRSTGRWNVSTFSTSETLPCSKSFVVYVYIYICFFPGNDLSVSLLKGIVFYRWDMWSFPGGHIFSYLCFVSVWTSVSFVPAMPYAFCYVLLESSVFYWIRVDPNGEVLKMNRSMHADALSLFTQSRCFGVLS